MLGERQKLTLASIPAEEPAVYHMLGARRFARRVPGGKPRADDHAAAPETEKLLRPGHRGGDRAPGADPGRHGASLFAPPQRPGNRHLPVESAGSGAVENARRAAVPGAGDEDRHRRRRLHAVGSRPAAPRHGHLQARRHHRHLPAQDDRRHAGQRLRARFRRALLPADRGLRRIRLSGKPRGELCAAGLCLGLAQMPLPGCLRRGAAQRAADGLLRAGADRARRARTRRRGAAAGRQSFGLGFDARARAARGGAPARTASRDARRHPRHACSPSRFTRDQGAARGGREVDRRAALRSFKRSPSVVVPSPLVGEGQGGGSATNARNPNHPPPPTLPLKGGGRRKKAQAGSR